MNLLNYNRFILPLWLVVNSLFNFSWIAFYPYMGYIVLVVNLLALISFFSISSDVFLVAFTTFIIIVLYFLIPRYYGPPNVTMLCYFFSFIFAFFYFNNVILKYRVALIRVMWFLFIMSIVQELLLYLGLTLPYEELEDASQIFKLYRPFYVDRVNIAKSSLDLFLIGQRFHGPFFEPGNTGFAAFILFILSKNKYWRSISISFGILTMSMFFFLLMANYLLFTLLSRFSIKKMVVVSGVIFGLILLLTYFNDSFIYASTLGRILGEGDKVLDTRNTVYEYDQIKLFHDVFRTFDPRIIFGMGFELPGSGGSYRQWILSTGVLFNLVIIVIGLYYLTVKVRLKTALLMIFLLAPFFYTRGNWFDINISILFAAVSRDI
jgi:hypothetical protein